MVAEDQWEEAEHELSRRLGILESQGRLTAEQRTALQQSVGDLVETRAIEVVLGTPTPPWSRRPPNVCRAISAIGPLSRWRWCSTLAF